MNEKARLDTYNRFAEERIWLGKMDGLWDKRKNCLVIECKKGVIKSIYKSIHSPNNITPELFRETVSFFYSSRWYFTLFLSSAKPFFFHSISLNIHYYFQPAASRQCKCIRCVCPDRNHPRTQKRPPPQPLFRRVATYGTLIRR